MDDPALEMIDRATALADFDHARDDFEDAFSQVPDEALDYKPEGDDYSFAAILVHVTRSIQMYTRVLDLMREAEFMDVVLAGVPGDYATVEEQPQTNDEDMALNIRLAESVMDNRRAALDALEASHDRLAARLRDLAEEDYTRVSPVTYTGSQEPYPTRASDLIRWLTDHYREHVVQIGEMLKQRESKTSDVKRET